MAIFINGKTVRKSFVQSFCKFKKISECSNEYISEVIILKNTQTINSLKNERLDYLDVVKGISTLLVIFCHTVTIDTAFHNCYLYFMLPVFFYVTGVLLAHNPSFFKLGYLENLKKNALAILYPYFTFSILSIIAFFCKEIFLTNNDFFTIIHLLKDILKYTILLYGYSALWYLPTLFFSKIIFIFFEKKSVNKWIVILLSIIISSVLSVCVSQFSGALKVVMVLVSRTLIGLFFIYIGYITYPFFLQKKETKKKQYFCSIISLFAFVLITIPCYFLSRVDIRCSHLGNPVLFYPIATISSLSLITLCKYLLKNCKFLAYIGKHSLVIFATHLSCELISLSWLLLSLVNKILQKLTLFTIDNDLILCLFVFVITTLVELLIIVPIMNKHFKFILKLPNKNKKK